MALVLGRKVTEAIIINGNIRVEITRIGSISVRVSVTAPEGISILREELVLQTTNSASRSSLRSSDISTGPTK